MDLQNLTLAEAEQILDRMSGVVRLGHLMHERDGVMPRIDLTSPPFIGFPVFDAAAVQAQIAAPVAEPIAAAHDPAPVSADCTGGVGGASRVEKPEAPRYHASAPTAGPSSPWTDEDDATLIAAVVEQVKAGGSMASGYALAAERMGRSAIACQTRGKQTLIGRIHAAIEAEGLEKPAPGKRAQPAPCRGNIRRTEIIGKAEAEAIMRDRDAGATAPQLAAKWDRSLSEIIGLLQRTARRADTQPEPDRSQTGAVAAHATQIEAEPVAIATPAQPEPVEAPAQVAPAQPRAGGLILPPDMSLPAGQRAMREHLNRLGNPGAFDPDTDLELVEGLSNGQKLPEIAADFGLDTTACKQRFERLTGTIRDDKGRVTIDGQRHLLAELRARVAVARGAA